MGILVRNNKVITAGGKILYSPARDPRSLINLKLYLSATRMVQQADGSLVSSYIDFSGFGYDATQTTSTLQPKFYTNQFGSNSGIKFDGTDDIMNLGGAALDIFRNVNQFTVQALVKRSVISTNSSIIQFTQNIGGSSRFIIQFTTTNIQVAVRMLDATVPAVSVFVPSNDLNGHLIQCTAISNVLYVYFDGVLAGSATMDSATSSNTPSANSYVGSLPGTFGTAIINGISVNQSYSDNTTIQAQYRGYLERGYL